MKKALFIGSVSALVIILALGTLYARQMGRDMMVQQGGHMGSGMMHHGEDMDSQRGQGSGPQYRPQYQEREKPMHEMDARRILENHLRSTRNPNLKLGRIEDRGEVFEAEILTRDDSLVDRLIVDKNTGRIRSAY
jgi:hypothetical protein